MVDMLVAPGTPWFIASLAGVCLTVIGARHMVAVQGVTRSTRAWSAWDYRGRLLFGQLAGSSLAAILVLTLLATGASGPVRLIGLSAAGALYLALGWVFPRRPIVQAQRERKRLRTLTPGFVSYARVALAGHDAPGEVLTRYVQRPRPKIGPMQLVVQEALQVMEAQRQRPFAALAQVARARGCQELIDVTNSLAQAESEGADVQAILEAQEMTLEQILTHEFTRMLKRRTLYLIALVAVSLVIGIMGNLLFVITGGGAVLMGA